MKIKATFVRDFIAKSGNKYYQFAVCDSGDTISASSAYCPVTPVVGGVYIIDVRPRVYEDRAFLAANVICEVKENHI